jgi:hypothetical protein
MVLDRWLGFHLSADRRSHRRDLRLEIRLATRTIGNLAAHKLVQHVSLELDSCS